MYPCVEDFFCFLSPGQCIFKDIKKRGRRLGGKDKLSPDPVVETLFSLDTVACNCC